ncbi:MAG: nitroreductase family deazaflavin-dependent oxidoreductase [bacterium]|jgi:deazaflavin-dependent oxidoreductase (nitroreductase family)
MSAEQKPEESRLVRVVTSSGFTWWVKHVAARIDPILYRISNGRWTSFGPPSMPMVTITMKGRRTGKKRSVHLAAVKHEGHLLVVASAMGQPKHPAWRYNLEANPEVDVQTQGRTFRARAEMLDDTEKARIWDDIRRVLPQMFVYEKRTDRNIRLFRLRPLQ